MVLGPDERIAIVPALRTVTSDAAWQIGEEDRKGSIEPGKLADFVVLEQNPLKFEAERLRELRVLETIVGGATVYQR
jgi:predicted amidohydrolase YtcJ